MIWSPALDVEALPFCVVSLLVTFPKENWMKCYLGSEYPVAIGVRSSVYEDAQEPQRCARTWKYLSDPLPVTYMHIRSALDQPL
jgi:hypothetical protein